MTDSGPDMEFARVARSKGLTDQTIEALCYEDFDCVEAVRSMDLDIHLQELKIDQGQTNKLQRWVIELQEPKHQVLIRRMKATESTLVSSDIGKSLSNLQNFSSIQSDITNHINQQGLSGIRLLVKKIFFEFKKHINIRVVGEPGVGKSSLVRLLCNENVQTEATAKHPELILWDYPNMVDTSRDQYTRQLGVKHFDAVTICSSRPFSEVDMWVATECARYHLPFYYVRTKIDLDIANDRRDRGADFDEVKFLQHVKEDIKKNLGLSNLPKTSVYIIGIESGQKDMWDFPLLRNKLITSIPSKNCTQLSELVKNAGKTALMSKYQTQKAEVRQTVDRVVAAEQGQAELFQWEAEKYARDYGSIEDNMTSWKRPPQIQIPKVTESRKGRRYGIWVFLIGYFFGWIADIIITYNRKQAAKVQLRQNTEYALGSYIRELYEDATMQFETELRKIV